MKASQTNLFEHSEAKVNLLGEYLKAYLPIITYAGFTKQIHLYDLFCGEGIYENQGEGSPLVLLKTVRDFYANYTGKPMIPKINFYFNDIEVDKIEKLKNVIEAKQLYQKQWGELHFSTERYEDKLPQVISHIKTLNGKKEKAFLFIDPYDYKSIRASQIKDLMCKESEVLLWQPTQFMYRFAENGTPQALIDFLSEIMEYMQWKNVQSIWDFIHQITDGFRNYLGSDYYIDTFSIKKDAQTTFCLYFFTSHPVGFMKMLETKWRIDEENGQGWDYRMDNMDIGLFGGQKPMPQTNRLKQKLILFLKNRSTYNGEIFQFASRNGFLPKHTAEVLKILDSEKRLKVIKNDTKAQKNTFYVTMNAFENQPKILSIQLR
ncbi:MAG: hypothetical protein RLZZ628_822 [Bacteroidota bacterium]|jgi:three-Cys-motif partner protein